MTDTMGVERTMLPPAGTTQDPARAAAWNQEEVAGYLTKKAGRQFDPEIVDIFLQRYQEVIS